MPDSTELRVLRQFYAATGGSTWTTRTGWDFLATATVLPANGTCHGLTVSNGDVTRLVLPNNRVMGSLPTSLDALSQLSVLHLAQNQLAGPLPAVLSRLSRLTELWLGNNQFSGPLPGALSNLAQLTVLSVPNNQFTGPLPPALGQLARLVTLDVSVNQFTGTLPAELGQLPRLGSLAVNNNQFSGPLPRYLFAALPNLRYVWLQRNAFTGALPAALTALPLLMRLDASFNAFTGPIPAGFHRCPQLQWLTLGNNQFTGSLPAELGQCPALERLFLSFNRFSGPLPAAWAALPLTYCDLNNNQLTGPIPTEYNRFRRLIRFNARNNRLSGPVPDSLKATYLNLDNNRLSGELPVSYATTTNAQITLDGNELTKIPRFAQPLGYPNLQLGITGNFLDFGSYEPNTTTPGVYQHFDYGQRTPGPPDTLAWPKGAFATLRRTPGGQSNVYQWERKVGNAWVMLAGETATTLRRGPLAEADEGEYRLKMTNTVSVGRTLYTRSVYLTLLPYAELPFNEPSTATLCPAQDTASGLRVRAGHDSVSYVRTFTVRVPLTDPALVSLAAPVAHVQTQTAYFDGLGRPVQTVQHRASPGGRDVVQPQAYDALGREPRAYLPSTADPAAAQPNGYHDNALRQQFDFHAGRGASAALTGNLPKTGVPYSETGFEPSPLNRPTAKGAPGEAWRLGQGHEQVLFERPALRTDSVPQYMPGYGTNHTLLTYQGLYADGELWLTQTRDEDRNLTQEYKDKQGRVVLRRTTSDKWRGAGTTDWCYRWLDTWYVYDDFGHLRATLPPLATQRVRANGYVIDGAGVDKLLFRSRFDAQGRAIETRTPDVDAYVHTVYDALDRPIMTQDAAQRARGQWLVTKYDALGRVVLTALVHFPPATSREALQTQADAAGTAANGRLYEEPAATGPVHFYTDYAFPALAIAPTGGQSAQVLSVSYYDGYDFDQSGTVDAAYSTRYDARLGGAAPVADARVMGQSTRTLVRLLGVPASTPGAWITTTTFYDERLRPIQVQASNARGGGDTLTTRYDYAGQALVRYSRHRVPGQAAVGVRDSMTYDHGGRLLTQVQQLDGQPKAETLTANAYEETGALHRQSLGGPLHHGLQNVDYGYNVRGWLTRINDAGLRGPAPTGQAKDLWGFELDYACGVVTPAFNGNIAGQHWRSRRDTVERFYGYRYDAANRLLQGDFIARAGVGQTWSGERSNHRFWAASYDANGNLGTLRRRGLVQTGTRQSAALYAETDHLHYRYSPAQSGNRLLAVDDRAPAPTLFAVFRQPERVDFKDVAGTTDYAYDANGSLTSDQNKRLSSISYNHLHLPEKLVFATATAGVLDSMRFVYTASGQKVAKLVYNHLKPGVVRTDYLGAFQYEQNKLLWLNTATGRALREVDSISGAIRFNYEHTLKDHLGNLRVAFRRSERRTYHAGLEPAAASIETKQFDPASVSAPIANNQQAASGDYSAMLYANGSHPQPIGPAKLWPVQGGDTLRVEVAAHYVQPLSGNSWHFALPTFLAGWLSQPAPGTNPDGSSTTRQFNWLQIGLAAGLSQLPSFGAGVPHGYLRLLIYRADSTVLQDRIVPITSAARTAWETIILPRFELPAGAAYAQVYVANESNVPVWFDNLTIEHWPGLNVQENHYDPFGLALVGLDQNTPGLRSLNRYQYTSKEKQTDFGLNWNDYGARMYNSQIGRWSVIDPVAQAYSDWSPYVFVRNNPILRLDPNGMWDITVHAYSNRKEHGYGIAVVTDRHGKEVYRFEVRLQGVGGEDRIKKNSDTPLGVYDIPDEGMWLSGGPRTSYGPNPRLVLTPESGEIKKSSRDLIRIHGGRQEIQNKKTGKWEPVKNAELKKTQGCLRCKDKDIKNLKDTTDELQKNDAEEKGGKLTVVADLEKEEVKGPHQDQYNVPAPEQPLPYYPAPKTPNR